MKNTSVVIVGGGPAGISAAIYLKRANIPFIIIEKSMPGGKLALTSKVENYPGYRSVDGVDLALKFQDHLSYNDIELTFDTISSIKKEADHFEIKGEFDEYISKYVILATGTVEKKLGLLNEEKFYGRGISFCAICDGSFYKNKDVIVIGGGNSALEESLYLADIARNVYLVHRRNDFRGQSILVDRVKEKENIKIVTPYVPSEIVGKDRIEGLKIKSEKDEMIINADGIFVFIGNAPSSDMIKDDIEMEGGYISVNDDMLTSISGLYAAGDVRVKKIRQIVTAVNDGAIAALSIEKEIKGV